MTTLREQLYEHWVKVRDTVDSMSMPGRALVLAAAFIVIFVLWSLFLNSPLKQEREKLANQYKTRISQTNLLEDRADLIVAEATHSTEASKQKYAALEKDLDALKNKLFFFADQIISPEKMTELLRELLTKETGLSLVQMKNLPLKALTPIKGDDLEGHQLYEQGVELTFRGAYFQTLDYLQQLEALKWRLFWDEFRYDVIDYPRAKVVIRVYTLTTGEQ